MRQGFGKAGHLTIGLEDSDLDLACLDGKEEAGAIRLEDDAGCR